MTTVAAALVTYESAGWLEQTLASIDAQTVRPDLIMVVDDGSTDGTLDILAARGIEAIRSTSEADDVTTRIAQNFQQVVLACGEADLVVLGDHDDEWLPNRVERQRDLLETAPDALMVASDGDVMDVDGNRTGVTLRSVFPVSADWDSMAPPDRMAYVLRRSVATGGASMLRPGLFPTLDVPERWLHDRWWSLMAVARDGLLIDTESVIGYRVQDRQQVGLDTGAQAGGSLRRLRTLVGTGGSSMAKYRDLHRLLRPLAVDQEIAAAIRLRNVL